MQELQEERKRLQALEHTSNISVDKTGNLLASTATSTSAEGNAESTANMTAEEQAAATGRRLRRRDDKELSNMNSTNGLFPTSINPSSTAQTAASNSASRRKQVNNIYTYSTNE